MASAHRCRPGLTSKPGHSRQRKSSSRTEVQKWPRPLAGPRSFEPDISDTPSSVAPWSKHSCERMPTAGQSFLSAPRCRDAHATHPLPCRPGQAFDATNRNRRKLLGLASSMVAMPRVSPRGRCALTAPFHPYLCPPCGGPSAVCFLLPVRRPPARDRRGRYPPLSPFDARTFLRTREACAWRPATAC